MNHECDINSISNSGKQMYYSVVQLLLLWGKNNIKAIPHRTHKS